MQLTALQEDAVTELINIAFSRAAASLSEITKNRVDLEVPQISVHPIDRLWFALEPLVQGEVASVHQVFTGPVAGDAFLLLNFEGAARLVDLLTESSAPSHYLGASAKEVITEVGNILMNACLGVFGNLLKIRFSFSVPRLSLDALEGLVKSVAIDREELQHALVVGARFRVRHSEVNGCLVLVLGITSLSLFVEAVENWAEALAVLRARGRNDFMIRQTEEDRSLIRSMELDQTFLEKLDLLGSWGVLATDQGLTVTFWNGWLEKHTGLAAGDVKGRNLLELFPDLAQRQMERYFQRVLEGQSFLLSQRLHNYLLAMPPTVGDAGLSFMQQTGRLVPRLEQGVVHGVLCLIEDVTERVASEAELRQRAAALSEANQHKDDFLAMLAHELRNPLGPTRNAVQILQLIKSPDPGLQKARDIIARQVTHMARLIDDLLDVSRLSLGKVLLRKERVDLGRLIRQTAEDYRSILEASGIGLTLQLAAEPLWVYGDGTRLAQMVGNLLHNAQKFTDVGGAVTVRTRLEDNAALIAVQDTGIGMQPETIARIFDTFSQADRSLARSRGGLGLGLALVKGLVELHDGTVHASSAGLGKGSEFAIRLPLHAGPDTKPVEPEITPTKGQSFRILVIEDNKDAAESTRMLLNLIGHEVQTAHNGETGIALARTFLPQVILCDIGLPGRLSGYDVAKALRQESAFHSTYIIALTGYGRDEDHQQTHAAGFDLHLIKPVDFANLRRTLATLPPRE